KSGGLTGDWANALRNTEIRSAKNRRIRRRILLKLLFGGKLGFYPIKKPPEIPGGFFSYGAIVYRCCAQAPPPEFLQFCWSIQLWPPKVWLNFEPLPAVW